MRYFSASERHLGASLSNIHPYGCVRHSNYSAIGATPLSIRWAWRTSYRSQCDTQQTGNLHERREERPFMQEEAREGRWTPTARRDGDRATWRSAADGRSFASHFPEEAEPEKHPHLGASVAAATGSATRRPASDEGQLSHPTPPHRNRVGQPSPAQAVEPTSSGAPFADSGGTCGKTTRFLPSSRPSTSGRRCHTADHNNHCRNLI